MSIEKGKISGFQFMFLIIAFVQGSGLLISFIDSITKHDSWLVIISAFLVCIPFVLLYLALAKMFPGSNLIEINDIIYGPYLGKFVSALYVSYFLILLSLNLRDLGDFYVNFIMPETPLIFLLICFTLVCAYALRNGIEPMARISFTLVILGLSIIALTIILLLKDMKYSNFLPVFEIPLQIFFQGTHTIAAIPFGEVVVFLMVISSVNNIENVRKFTLWGLSLSALYLLTISMRNTAVLGNLSTIYISSGYQVTRLIDIGNFLTRLEVLIAISITTALFMKISILYYATVLGLSQITRLRTYLPLILPIGSIAVCLSLIIYDSTIDHAFQGVNYNAIQVTPFEFILPPLSLLIAKLRGFSKKRGE